MMRSNLFFAAVLSLGLSISVSAADRVGDFALLDHTGTFHQLSYYGDHDAVVILVNGGTSLAQDGTVSAVSNIASNYAGNAQFWVLNPVSADSRADDCLIGETQERCLERNLPEMTSGDPD